MWTSRGVILTIGPANAALFLVHGGHEDMDGATGQGARGERLTVPT